MVYAPLVARYLSIPPRHVGVIVKVCPASRRIPSAAPTLLVVVANIPLASRTRHPAPQASRLPRRERNTFRRASKIQKYWNVDNLGAHRMRPDLTLVEVGRSVSAGITFAVCIKRCE
jgi:hypothetical protein